MTGHVDVLIAVNDLGAAVRAGLCYGTEFSKVRLLQPEDDAPVLRFGNDENTDEDVDDDELDRLLALL